MSDSIARRRPWPCQPAGILTVLFLVAGCSAGGDSRTSGTRPQPAETTVAAAPTTVAPAADARPPLRMVPEVVSRPRPFRLGAPTVAAGPAEPGTPAAPGTAVEPRRVDPPTLAVPMATLPPVRPAADAPAVAEIRDMLRGYLRAFNRHDAESLAAHWAPAGETIDLDSGDVTAGREAVRNVFAALFAEDDQATLDIDVTSVRPIRPDVAVVDGVTRVAFAGAAPAGSRFTAVVVRDGGRWLLESVRESSRPEEAADHGPLDDVAWLAGSWEDAGAGVTASTQAFWSTDRAFLVRTHAVRSDATAEPRAQAAGAPGLLPPGEATAREVFELVGWDPDRQTVRSWLFSSAGRFAEATWTRGATAGTWTMRVEGRGRDEGATCTCTVSADGADALTMTCDSDALAGLLPPACRFERTTRFGGPPAE